MAEKILPSLNKDIILNLDSQNIEREIQLLKHEQRNRQIIQRSGFYLGISGGFLGLMNAVIGQESLGSSTHQAENGLLLCISALGGYFALSMINGQRLNRIDVTLKRVKDGIQLPLGRVIN